MRVAALDFGTNSFLLLVQEKQKDGSLSTLHDESVIVRLGEGLEKSKMISSEALSRAEQCLSEFEKTILRLKPQKIQAVSTAAAREAKNAKDFFALCEKHRIPVALISGEEEAQLSYWGAISPEESGRCLVLDIGGGSTEAIVGEGKKIQFAESLPIGAVKMTEKFIQQQPTPIDQVESLRNFLEKTCKKTWSELHGLKPKKMVAVAGTPTALAACEWGQFDAQKIEGTAMTQERLQMWVEKLSPLSVEEKKQKYPLGKRADVILAGAIILSEYLKAVGLNEIIISTKGIRYGLAQSLFQSHR